MISLLGTFRKLNEEPNQNARNITQQYYTTPTRKRALYESSSSNQEPFEPYQNDDDDDQENKENSDPQVVLPSFSRGMLTRCSSLFKSKPNRQHISKTRAPLQPLNIINTSNGMSRKCPIPDKQGYMYKKSKTSGVYRRKYVALCSDRTITYYPSFQSYVENVDGKEIRLGHVILKIPGSNPYGLKITGESLLVGEECNQRDSWGQEMDKSKQVLREEETAANELLLASPDGSQWHFRLCSFNEVAEWKKAIHLEIHQTLVKPRN